MGVNTTFDGNWQHYWQSFTDVKMLKKWSADMDQLLQKLEKQLGTKLLARDHFEIIEGLENRIEQLERESGSRSEAEHVGVQGELFNL